MPRAGTPRIYNNPYEVSQISFNRDNSFHMPISSFIEWLTKLHNSSIKYFWHEQIWEIHKWLLVNILSNCGSWNKWAFSSVMYQKNFTQFCTFLHIGFHPMPSLPRSMPSTFLPLSILNLFSSVDSILRNFKYALLQNLEKFPLILYAFWLAPSDLPVSLCWLTWQACLKASISPSIPEVVLLNDLFD